MKLADIIKNIDKSEDNEAYFDLGVLSSDLGLNFYYYEEDQEHIKAYWLQNWWCTDTCVGTRVYFFDDEAVAVSVQNGRKMDEKIFWVSEEAAGKVRDFIYSLQKKELNLTTCDLDEDLGDSYKIEFNAQVIDWSMARYNGEPIELVERILETPNYGIDKTSKIRVLSTGEELVVHIKDLDFLYCLKQPENNALTNTEVTSCSVIRVFFDGVHIDNVFANTADVGSVCDYIMESGVDYEEATKERWEKEGNGNAKPVITFEIDFDGYEKPIDDILSNASNRSAETGTVKDTKGDVEIGKE